MKKIIKFTSSILLAVIMMIASMINVNAAADSIGIGTATKINTGHIAGITFSYKVTSDGRYLYCLNRHKNTATNTTARLVSNSSLVDGGVVHILKNGYPEKSILGDREKDYYITQMAVWMYLDKTHGTSNVGNIKTKPSEAAMMNQVNRLVNEGIAHRSDSSKTNTSLAINVSGSNALYPQSNYYLSNEITATQATNVSSYAVTLENQPANTLIFQSGREFQYTGAFTVGVNETFRIKIMNEAASNRTITVNATAVGNNGYGAYEYQPVNGNMQNVVLLEKESTTVKSSVKLTLAPTPPPKTRTVTINKIDATTKKPLAGAKLVIKNADTKAVVASFTTTDKPYVITTLKDGSYTVEETEAPNGYALSKEVKSFTLSEKTNNVTVTFTNEELGSLSINKIDAKTKKPLAGAVLVLKNESGKELARWTTTINAHIIKNLAPGTYTVSEIQAPEGYVLNTKPVTVVVTESKKSYSVSMENTPKNIVININKIDKETNKPLAGAVLVVKDSTGKVIVRFTTTEQPHVITDIANGTYTVEEEIAPAGYIKSNEKITFTVDDNHQSHQITISNTKETPVPDTGTESIIFVLIGAIILGIGLEFILKNAKA